MRRRRGGIGFFGFIIIMTLLDAFLEGPGYFLFGMLLPLGIFALIMYGFYRLINYFFADSQSSNRSSSSSKTYRYNRQSQVHNNKNTSYVRNSSNAAIDKVLSDYFKDNVSLILFDDVSISTQGGTYTTVDNLYVSYKGEKICQMKELKGYYPDSYNKIIEALGKLAKKGGNAKEMAKEDSKKTEPIKEKKKDQTKAEVFIDQINALNNDIVNEEVTNGLYQTCDLLKQIDLVDREDGKLDSKLNKLYEYYLPILVGILQDYKRLSNSAVKSDEFKKCETQLVKTIKLINEALKTIYNSLHESDYMNLNADINTLQSLLKQDGLVDVPFRGGSDE